MTDLERLAEALDHLHAADIRMNELEAINARQRAELVSARHEAGALRRALDIITRAGDIESARNLALAILERLEGAQPAAIVPLEDVRAADLCELAAARLRRDDARLVICRWQCGRSWKRWRGRLLMAKESAERRLSKHRRENRQRRHFQRFCVRSAAF